MNAKQKRNDDALKIFREGESAYEHGIEICDNPYERGTDQFRDWQSGWLDAHVFASRYDYADNI